MKFKMRKSKPVEKTEKVEEKVELKPLISAELLNIPELEEKEEKPIINEPVDEHLAEDEEYVEEERLGTFQSASLINDEFIPKKKKRKKIIIDPEGDRLKTLDNIKRPSIFQLIILGLMAVMAFINPWIFFALAILMIITIIMPFIIGVKNRIKEKMTKRTEEKMRKILIDDEFEPDRIMHVGEFLFKYSSIRKLEAKIREQIRKGIFESGLMADSSKLSHHGVIGAFLGFIITVPAGIIAAFLLHPAFLLIIPFPLVMLTLGRIKLKMNSQERKSAIEHELPVFIACVTIMEAVGINVYRFMDKIALTDSTLFPTIKKDIRLVRRNKQFIGMEDLQALKKIAETHPSKDFQTFVTDYQAASVTSKTNAEVMLQATTEKALHKLSQHSVDYTKSADSISQVTLLLMAMGPIMGLATTFLTSGKDSVSLVMMLILFLPIMSIMIILMIDGKQPKTNNPVTMKYTWAIGAIVTGVVCLLIGMQLWAVMGLAVGVGAFINMMQTKKYFSNIDKVDAKMPGFLDYVKSSRTEGIQISVAIKNQAYREEPGPFKNMLIYLNAHLVQGGHLSEVVEGSPTRSWLAKIVFFVLGQVNESGGGSPDTMRAFSDMVKKIEQSKSEMVKSLKGSLMMGYMIPVIMVMMLVATEQMTSGLGDDLQSLEELSISFPTPEQAEVAKQQSYFLVVLCCILIGIIVSKVVYFSLKHTKHVAMLSFLAVILCSAVPYIPALG